MESNKNISFTFFFIFILFTAIFGNQNIIYDNYSEYLLENEYQFVDIKNSILQNKLIFFILLFLPFNLIIVSKIFKKYTMHYD